MKAEKALDYHRRIRHGRIFGRTAAYIPLLHLAERDQTRLTYAKILEVLALNPTTYTPREIHQLIKQESINDDTLGYPLPSAFSEKRPTVPSEDSVSDAIDTMVQHGYVRVDQDKPAETVAGKVSYHYDLTSVGKISAQALKRVQDNMPRYYQCNPYPKEDVLGTQSERLIFELGLWELNRRITDQTCRLFLIVKGLAERQSYEVYPDSKTPNPRNDFESLDDEKADSIYDDYAVEAMFRIVESIKAGQENGGVKEDYKRLMALAKNKDPRVMRVVQEWTRKRAEKRKKQEEFDEQLLGGYLEPTKDIEPF